MARKNLNAAHNSKTPSSTVLETPVSNSVTECKLNTSEEERKEQFEKYQTTGEFEKDILELSSILNIPIHVSHRVKLPSSQDLTTANVKGKDDKKKDTTPGPPSTANEGSICNFAFSPIPTTFLVSENKDYFKAKITIDTETEGNKTFIKEVSLRGWLAEERVLNMFTKTFSYLDKLQSLYMWRAGLTDETLVQLYNCLKSSSSLKTLSLDGNISVKNQLFDIFIRSKDNGKLALQNFSLRNCKINETGAFHLGSALSENTSLFSLNLSCNLLGDSGAKHIADGLRLNRALLSLNLASNHIGDEGVKNIAQVLKGFPLSHEEIVARRFMITTYSSEESMVDDNSSSQKSGKKSKENKQPKRPESTASKGGGGGGGNKLEITSSEAHNKRSKIIKKGRRASRTEHGESPVPEDYEPIHPFLEKVKTINGELWIPGNRALINLNLSRNKISSIGLNLLNSAMQHQGLLALENRVIGGILRRLSVQKNNFSSDDSTFIALEELMRKRDPLYKPSLENCEEETQA